LIATNDTGGQHLPDGQRLVATGKFLQAMNMCYAIMMLRQDSSAVLAIISNLEISAMSGDLKKRIRGIHRSGRTLLASIQAPQMAG
jgi:hypothetical protein